MKFKNIRQHKKGIVKKLNALKKTIHRILTLEIKTDNDYNEYNQAWLEYDYYTKQLNDINLKLKG